MKTHPFARPVLGGKRKKGSRRNRNDPTGTVKGISCTIGSVAQPDFGTAAVMVQDAKREAALRLGGADSDSDRHETGGQRDCGDL